jgi:hypothetical protein
MELNLQRFKAILQTNLKSICCKPTSEIRVCIGHSSDGYQVHLVFTREESDFFDEIHPDLLCIEDL